MVKRKSPEPDDIDRINEMLEQRAEFQIQDADSYELAFDDYMGIVKADADQIRFRKNAFDDYVQKHPDVSTEHLFKDAKGASLRGLRQDRRKTAKRVVTTKKDYIKYTAPEVDLKGYDTARQRLTKLQRIQREFTIPARSKGRVVYAMRTSVVVRDRKMMRHRDPRGRFVSIRLR